VKLVSIALPYRQGTRVVREGVSLSARGAQQQEQAARKGGQREDRAAAVEMEFDAHFD